MACCEAKHGTHDAPYAIEPLTCLLERGFDDLGQFTSPLLDNSSEQGFFGGKPVEDRLLGYSKIDS